MRHRNDKLDVAGTLTADFLLCHLNAATVAHDAFVTYALVFAASTLIVLCRAKDALAEQAIALGLIGAVVYRFRLCYFTIRTFQYLLR